MYICMYEFKINAGWRSQEFQQNTGNNSDGIPSQNSIQILEFQRYCGQGSGGIPARVVRNTGGMPAIILLEFQLELAGIPAEC